MRRTAKRWSVPSTGTVTVGRANSTLSSAAAGVAPGAAHAATVAAPSTAPAFRNSRRFFFMSPRWFYGCRAAPIVLRPGGAQRKVRAKRLLPLGGDRAAEGEGHDAVAPAVLGHGERGVGAPHERVDAL